MYFKIESSFKVKCLIIKVYVKAIVSESHKKSQYLAILALIISFNICLKINESSNTERDYHE
jgi:hypothetical protein